jgi:hypothetical protein
MVTTQFNAAVVQEILRRSSRMGSRSRWFTFIQQVGETNTRVARAPGIFRDQASRILVLPGLRDLHYVCQIEA